MNVPLARPSISEEDIAAVVDVLRTPNLSLGPKLAEFEEAFCHYTGARYATAVSSGTAALHLAIRSLGIGSGAEVITTPFSFVASANCVLFEDARPVFVDIDPVTFNLDPDLIEEKITSRTRAILPVHIFGRPVNMDHVLRIAARHDLAVIEDACEALGGYWRDRHVGTFGAAGTFAFYPNKQITTGEGGMLVSNDADLDQMFKSLRNQGRGSNRLWLHHERLGYNYRISELNCALGISQLKRVDELLQQRARAALLYREHLQEIEGLQLPVYEIEDALPSWFVYVVQLRDSNQESLDRFIQYLRTHGVECSNYFSPIHKQPYFLQNGHGDDRLPVTEKVAISTVALPFFASLSEGDVAYVASTIRDFFTGRA